MDLTKQNLPVYASRFYTNENCESVEEFEDDLNKYKLSIKLARKILSGKSDNIRLLCNHVMCFTNNFELQAAKKILMLEATKEEKMVLKTVLNYFGFLTTEEMLEIPFSTIAAKALQEMDK